MDRKTVAAKSRCRVWVVRYDGEPPADWHDIPVGAVAVEPAERRTMPPGQARRYVETFNRAALAGGRKVWAVALPVRICHEGDLQPGQALAR